VGDDGHVPDVGGLVHETPHLIDGEVNPVAFVRHMRRRQQHKGEERDRVEKRARAKSQHSFDCGDREREV
jgi:hypothetical protein